MSSHERLLEDPIGIRVVFQRLLHENRKLSLGFKEFKDGYVLVGEEPGRIGVLMPPSDIEIWGLGVECKVSVHLEDRGLRYEGVLTYEGWEPVEGIACARFATPRSLRRADGHRVVDFVPETESKCTFTNARNALLDGHVRGFGAEGIELALRDPRQNIQDFMRLGEESMLDIPLDGGPHIVAKTKVAYFEANKVGLTFSEEADQALMGQYRNWLQGQQQLQAQRDREELESGRARDVTRTAALPGPRMWSDKAPLILVLTEREDFARHMGEALGRKFGIASLDYIKGPLRPLLKDLGVDDAGWGRVRLILVHNKLRVASPMELTHQIVEQEKCPLPLLAVGTEEDEELKRNRFIASGAVDFLPVEPFRILTVLRKIDETLKLFA